MKSLLVAFLLLSTLSASAAEAPAIKGRGPAVRPLPGGPGPAAPAPEPDWAQSDIVFYGKLDEVVAGPVAKSLPPIYNHSLTFTVEKVLRGDLKAGEAISGNHSARQMEAPAFPEGEKCLVAATFVRGSYRIAGVKQADAAAAAKMAAKLSLPLGWSTGGEDKPVSPWSEGSLAREAKISGIGDDLPTCSVSGRPALMAGKCQIGVSPVDPAKSIKWTNPDGDGEYEIVISNPTDEEIQVPALLTDGKKIFWDECLVILCQKEAYAIPAAKSLAGNLHPVTLAPGEKISHVVNALSLDGPNWPRGGYRIEFQFCLGEKSARHSFYYMSRHHDALRDKAQKEAGGK